METGDATLNAVQPTSKVVDDEDLFSDLIGDIDSLSAARAGAVTTNDDDLLLEMQELLS